MGTELKEAIIQQEPDDIIYIVNDIKSPFYGHEALWRCAKGKKSVVIILEKNNKIVGKVRVLDVIDVQGEKPSWLIPPDAH